MLTYGEMTIDETKLPPVSVTALMQYGVSHFLGNVQASKLVNRIRGKEGLNKSDATTEAVKAWRTANAEVVAAWTAEHIKEAIKELEEGTVGTRASGPRLDPVEREFKTILERRLTNILKGQGLKLPKTDDETLVFASGMTRTREQMLANLEVSEGEALRKEAVQKVGELARKAKREQEESAKKAASGPVDPGSLGI